MLEITVSAKTLDDAITEALIELGASTEEVEIEVISKGSKGLLGFGAKEAKVRVTLKQAPIQEELEVEEINEITPNNIVINEEVKSIDVKGDSENSIVDSEEQVRRVIQNAEDFLKKLLNQMGIECTINSEIAHENRISISLEGKNMGIIIGKRGETLDAIQYLVNIVANKERKEYIKIMLDTENYRARREETLRKLAFKLSKKVQKSKKPIILEPMNPYDRRIIHSALQDSKFVKTHSEGKEPFRKVVIAPNYHNRLYK